jgi:hypothetical protein
MCGQSLSILLLCLEFRRPSAILPNMQLSKSEYMMFLKHPAWVWLKKHRKKLLPKPSPALQARFDEGHYFEQFAEALFNNINRLHFDNYREYLSLPLRTRAALDQGASAITQGRFEAGDLTCIVDILERVSDSTFDLFEIKSSTSVKDDHIYDLAFQRSVLERAGLTLKNIHVLFVDKTYVRNGAIDAKALVAREDVTGRVSNKMEATGRLIDRALEAATALEMPDPSPRHARLGAFQEWLDILATLKGDIPDDSIYRLPQANAKVVATLEDAGVRRMHDITDLSVLSPTQQRFIALLRHDQRHVDKGALRKFLGDLSYPLAFLDYKTSQSLIPPFDGLRPYQQLPFQYSLHIQNEPGGPVSHTGYLHRDNSNPVPALVKQLRRDVGRQGSVLVWYQGFETSRNTEMARLVPEHTEFLNALNDRVVDLMHPFRQGWVVDKTFGGSNSIKKVLPVLVSELSYGDLAVKEGETASRLWKEVVIDGKHADNAPKNFNDLDQYCALDTWAMVRILEVLQQLADASDNC